MQNQSAVREEQGFEVYALSNREGEIAIVPRLGARIISLRNSRTGREWLWHPAASLKLFANAAGDDFARGPLAGIDECLPTITPCVWKGRRLPDHGEVWSQPWRVDEVEWKNGVLKTTVKLNISPLEFERTITLDGGEIQLHYRLTNRSATEERFVWAIHPLLRMEPGDCLDLPESTGFLLNGKGWGRSLDSTLPAGECAKIFAGPLADGSTRIENATTGDWLHFEWNPAENNTLGLWLSRGGWHGHHHFAIEPTNAAHDSLDRAVAADCCGRLAGFSSVGWQLRLRLGSARHAPSR